MAFDIEWTARSYGDEADRIRGIEAAEAYCAEKHIDAACAWAEQLEAAESGEVVPDAWSAIEYAAFKAMFEGWAEWPENVSLVWN